MYGNHTFKSHAKDSYPALQAHMLVPIGWRDARTKADVKRPNPLYRKNLPVIPCAQLPNALFSKNKANSSLSPPCHQVSCSLNASLNRIVNHRASFFIKCPLVRHSMARERWGNLWQQCHISLLFRMERLQKEPSVSFPSYRTVILPLHHVTPPRGPKPTSKHMPHIIQVYMGSGVLSYLIDWPSCLKYPF